MGGGMAFTGVDDGLMQRIDLLTEAIAQLNKDFSLSGWEAAFSGQPATAWQELCAQVAPVIDYMLEHQPERFWAVLYSIDLDEQQVRKVLLGGEPHAIARITELILMRELQKVVTRHRYAGRL